MLISSLIVNYCQSLSININLFVIQVNINCYSSSLITPILIIVKYIFISIIGTNYIDITYNQLHFHKLSYYRHNCTYLYMLDSSLMLFN